MLPYNDNQEMHKNIGLGRNVDQGPWDQLVRVSIPLIHLPYSLSVQSVLPVVLRLARWMGIRVVNNPLITGDYP